MKLSEARKIIREVQGRPYAWLEGWGLSLIKKAIYTINDRKSATDSDRELAESVQRKITYRNGW